MKLRSLLYDAGCSACTDVAQQAEAEARGWLRVKPLQDETMQALLEKHAPNVGRRTALITQNDGRVAVDTGWTMVIKLALGMGPIRCMRLLRRLALASPPPLEHGSSAARRHLLRIFGGGTLATLSTVVMAHPAAESEGEAVLLDNEAYDAAIAAARGDAHVQIAEQQVLGQGFLPSTDSSVVLRSKLGDQLTMIFYPDAYDRTDRCGVVVQERLRDGTTRVLAEVVQVDPKGLFDSAGRFREGALQTVSSIRIAANGGVVVPADVRGFIRCMFACIGTGCAGRALHCGRLGTPQLVLACIAAICSFAAVRCGIRCRNQW